MRRNAIARRKRRHRSPSLKTAPFVTSIVLSVLTQYALTLPPLFAILITVALYFVALAFDHFVKEFRTRRTNSPKPIPPIPLEPIDKDNAGRLLEREGLIQKISRMLQDTSTVILLTGESGTGKSSLLKAAFVRRYCMDRGMWWVYVDGGYGRDEALVEQLKRIQLLHNPSDALAAMLNDLKAGFHNRTRDIDSYLKQELPAMPYQSLQQALAGCDGIPLCIVLDQFEQLFFCNRNPSDRELFFDTLLAFVQSNTKVQRRMVLSFRKEWLLDVFSQTQTLKPTPDLVVVPGLSENSALSLIPNTFDAGTFGRELIGNLKSDGQVKPIQLVILSETLNALGPDEVRSETNVERLLDRFLELLLRGYSEKQQLLRVLLALSMDREKRRALSLSELQLILGDSAPWVSAALVYLCNMNVVRKVHNPVAYELMHDYLAVILGDRVEQQLSTETIATMRFVNDAMKPETLPNARMSLIKSFSSRWRLAHRDSFLFACSVAGTALLLTRFFAGGILHPIYDKFAPTLNITSPVDVSYIPCFIAMFVSQFFVYRYLSDFFRFVPRMEPESNKTVNRGIALLCLGMLGIAILHKEIWPLLAGIGATAIAARCLLFRHQCRENIQIFRRFTQYSRVTFINGVIFMVVGSILPILAHHSTVVPNGEVFVTVMDWAFALIAAGGILYQMSIHFADTPMEAPFGYRLRGEVVRLEKAPNLDGLIPGAVGLN